MKYRVIARFYDKATDTYVETGEPCPALDAETVDRLLRAKCIIDADSPAAAAYVPPRRTAVDIPPRSVRVARTAQPAKAPARNPRRATSRYNRAPAPSAALGPASSAQPPAPHPDVE